MGGRVDMDGDVALIVQNCGEAQSIGEVGGGQDNVT